MKGTMRLLVLLLVPSIGYSQFYVGADVGYASAEFGLGEPYNGLVDDNSFVFGAGLGYGVRENVAAEISWYGYSNFEGLALPCPPGEECPPPVQQVTTSGNDIGMLTVAAVPRMTFGDADEFELFGNVGYYRARVDTDIAVPDSEFSRRGVVLGVGARWEVSEPWNVHIEANRFGDRMSQFTVGFGWQAAPFSERP